LQKENQAVNHLNYQITYEALPHESLKQLPISVQEQATELYCLIRSRPAQVIAPLQKLTEKYPEVPVFYNYLRTAYEMIGQSNKADQLLEIIYRKYPDYLFGKINYAFRCLNTSKPEKLVEIFGNKFDLRLLYPHRKIFHISEFTAFTSVIALYLDMIGDHQNARKYYRSLKYWAPNHSLTQVVKVQLFPTLSQRLFEKFDTLLNKLFDMMANRFQNKIAILETANATKIVTSNHSPNYSRQF
jgi:tetratricopeptide (TPR) repeat protein